MLQTGNRQTDRSRAVGQQAEGTLPDMRRAGSDCTAAAGSLRGSTAALLRQAHTAWCLPDRTHSPVKRAFRTARADAFATGNKSCASRGMARHLNNM
jgi:hypothetical protein